MVAVGSPREAGVVVSHVLADEEARAVGEDDVVLGEAFLRDGRGGDDENGAGAEAEEYDWAIAGGDLGQASEEGFLQEVKMPDYGERKERRGRVVSDLVEEPVRKKVEAQK